MEFTVIEVEIHDKIATIYLNRPERLNAIDSTVRAELITVCDERRGLVGKRGCPEGKGAGILCRRGRPSPDRRRS